MTDEMRGRQLVGSVFVGVLYGVAFSQMITTFRQAVPTLSPSGWEIVLPIIFVVTSTRFVIGHAFHFIIDIRPRLDWSVDAGFVFLMSFIMILLGVTSSIDASRTAALGFATLLIWFYVTDLVLLLIVHIQRRDTPLHQCWFWINAGVVGIIGLTWALRIDFYSPIGLLVILVSNSGAYVLDIACSLKLEGAATGRQAST